MSICNFRCSYCYLAQREECYQGVQPKMKYTPEEFGKAMSAERVGGKAFANFTAQGETLLVTDIDKYVKAFVQHGHYTEIVTNLTVTKVLEKFLEWDKELLKHLEFKCSFHYIQLKKKNLLDVFADNVKKIWEAGASANIELVSDDELIPYIDEVKDYSMKNFGALPHVTIARDDRTRGIDYLTTLSIEDYDKVWSQFESDFWKLKKTIFGVKQKEICYAGEWSMVIDLSTGLAKQCYDGDVICEDVFKDPLKSFPEKAKGRCRAAHCYNGHALITMGLIPDITDVGYGNIRNRIKDDGSQWLQPELLSFFNSKLEESNPQMSYTDKTLLKVDYYTRYLRKMRYLPAYLKYHLFEK